MLTFILILLSLELLFYYLMLQSKNFISYLNQGVRIMKKVLFTALSGLALLVSSSSIFAAPDFDPKTALSKPKDYVGSGVCKTCHLEHYDAWQRTLHSKMLQDVKKNADAFVTEIDEATVRADFAEKEGKLKVPSSQVHVPKMEDVHYTIGSQWKQRYLVKKDGTYLHRTNPV